MRTGKHNRGAGSFSDRSKRSISKSSQANSLADAKRNYERYVALARGQGDAVEAENFYQHAEHYLRLMKGSAV